jgi:hypothetical protein
VHKTTPTPTPKQIDILLDLNLTCADEAEIVLREMFEDDIIITRTPDKDRWESFDEFRHFRYAFIANFSIMGVPADNDTIYIFVRHGERRGIGLGILFEEIYPYSLLTGTLFPVPMHNGELIPYDFTPGFNSYRVSYYFEDWDVMQIYENQLRAAGFTHHGRVRHEYIIPHHRIVSQTGFYSESYWSFNDIDQNIRYAVSFNVTEGIGIMMWIEPLDKS